MAQPSVSQFRFEFDDFLYAPVDESNSGTLLSVLSALARLDVDPWQEAASLARMSRESATQRLASLIVALPGGLLAHLDSRTIAIRLIALLPRAPSFKAVQHETLPQAGTLPISRAIIYVVIINAIFMALASGSQYSWQSTNLRCRLAVRIRYLPARMPRKFRLPVSASDYQSSRTHPTERARLCLDHCHGVGCF